MGRNLQDSNICVTGGSGFIGSHLVDYLSDIGVTNITVVDNYFLGNEKNLEKATTKNKGLRIVRTDASDYSSMQSVIKKHSIDYVFNLAVIPLPTSLEYPAFTIEKNIAVVSNLCELARQGTYSKLVHCSSSEAYGTAEYVPMDETHPLSATTPYASSKAAGDLIIKTYVETFGIKALIVRPFNTFGPRQNSGSYAGIIPIVLNRIKAGLPIEIHGDGSQTRDFIYVARNVENIVKASQVHELEGKIINIASGVETSIKQLILQILRIMNLHDYPIEYVDARPGDVSRHLADIDLAKKYLGMKQTEIKDSDLRETIKWYE